MPSVWGRRYLAGMSSATSWHPLLATVEPEPGVWVMLDPEKRPYGLVRLSPTSEGLRFKAVHAGVVIGWGMSLRGACERIHHAEVSRMTRGFTSGAPGVDELEGRADAERARQVWVDELLARYQ